tara:strand:- start:1513 stop:2205 length:693 start_codon:yes stop_codon:yes gene_type:complete
MLKILKNGETVDLAIPTEHFALNSQWYSWFNRPDLTKYLYWGTFENTPELQAEYFRNLEKNKKVFIIQTKNHIPCGVISFSKINMKNKSADWAILKDNKIEPQNKRISALESVAMLIEYGFEDLGLKRISCGQHVELKGWQNRLELLGFKLEGIHEKKYVFDKEVADAQSLSCQYEDYIKIKKFRGNKIWDSKIKMLDRINNLPKKTLRESLDNFFENERLDYYNKVFFL